MSARPVRWRKSLPLSRVDPIQKSVLKKRFLYWGSRTECISLERRGPRDAGMGGADQEPAPVIERPARRKRDGLERAGKQRSRSVVHTMCSYLII